MGSGRGQGEQWIVQGLLRALAEVPGISVDTLRTETTLDGRLYDAIIDVMVRDQPLRFVIEARSTAYPRDVRQALDRLEAVRARPHTIPLFAAPRIGATARASLRAARLGYFDEGGTLYVDATSASAFALLIDRERPPLPQPRRARELFRGQGARVLHVLLGLYATRSEWNIKELAQQAGVSDSTVHKVFSRLEADGTVDRVGTGPRTVRHVIDPGAILDEWSEHHELAAYQSRRYAGWAQGNGALQRGVCEALAVNGVEYALTLQSGAQLVAPFATAVPQVDIIVPLSAELGFLGDAPTGLVEVGLDGGENVVLRVTDEGWPLMRRQEVDGLIVASDIQLYLDLIASPRRGRELAQRLREQRLDWG